MATPATRPNARNFAQYCEGKTIKKITVESQDVDREEMANWCLHYGCTIHFTDGTAISIAEGGQAGEILLEPIN